jgi:ABC-type multidrug transport system fused ATPase/permease subunit
MGFYQPTSGQILLDGVDIATLFPEDYRSRIAIVEQEPSLFDLSVRQNICYGQDQEPYEVFKCMLGSYFHLNEIRNY